MKNEKFEELVRIFEAYKKTQSVSNHSLIQALNSIQRNISFPKISEFNFYMNGIFDNLLYLCDEKDVSVRHSASTVFKSIVSFVLPFSKSFILQFISDRCSKEFKPHALVCMVEISLNVTLYLTFKTANELFILLTPLLKFCALSSSEIVSEGFFRISTKIRCFYCDIDMRLSLIKDLSTTKESVLSNRWSIRSAAIFAHPDLVERCISFFNPPFLFLSSLPIVQVPDSLIGIQYDELLPFVEEYPSRFMHLFESPPDNIRYLSSFLSCLKEIIPHGYSSSNLMSIISQISSDPVIQQNQLECISILNICGNNINPYFGIKELNYITESALSLSFNMNPSFEVVDTVLESNIDSPLIGKSVVHFLCSIDYRGCMRKYKNPSIKKIIQISKFKYPIIQDSLIDCLPKFCGGEYQDLFISLLTSIDPCDSLGFKNSFTLLALLSSDKVIDSVNALMSIISEIDPTLYSTDLLSLQSFFDNISVLCRNCSRIRIPNIIASFSLSTLAIIVSILRNDFNSTSKHLHLSQLYSEINSPELEFLRQLLERQPLISILELRNSLCLSIYDQKSRNSVYDDYILDYFAKKMISWPSSSIWKLISFSSKSLLMTTAGILSIDPEIVAASINISNDMNSIPLMESDTIKALDMIYNSNYEVSLTLGITISIDKLVNSLPNELSSILENQWYIVGMKNNLDSIPVLQFIKKPYHLWNGPHKFWKMLPDFLIQLYRYHSWRPFFEEELCDSYHKFFAKTHLCLFDHRNIILPTSFSVSLKTVYNQSTEDDDSDYLDTEIIRNKRKQLYVDLNCTSFYEICRREKTSDYCSMIQKLINIISDINCSESFYDALLYCVELCILTKNQSVFSSIIPFLYNVTFRSYGLHILSTTSYHKLQSPQLAMILNNQILLEHEAKVLSVYFSKINMKPPIELRILTQISLSESHIQSEDILVYLKYSIIPPYSYKHETSLSCFVRNNGVSNYSLRVLSVWIKSNSPYSLIKSILELSSLGSYFLCPLSTVLRKPYIENREIFLIIESHFLVSCSPLLINLLTYVLKTDNLS